MYPVNVQRIYQISNTYCSEIDAGEGFCAITISKSIRTPLLPGSAFGEANIAMEDAGLPLVLVTFRYQSKRHKKGRGILRDRK